MTIFLSFLLIICFAGCATLVVFWLMERRIVSRVTHEADTYRHETEKRQQENDSEIEKLKTQVARLAKWTSVADADDKARELVETAQATLSQAESDSRILIANAEQQYSEQIEKAQEEAAKATAEGRAKAKKLTEEAQASLSYATERSSRLIADAKQRAEEIAGKAYDVVENVDRYRKTAKAMKNIIDGYGDEYLIPAESLLDDLAEEYSHKEAGQELKFARKNTKTMIKAGTASRCKYVETNRREGAERFVLDAFNGKVDSILSRVKHDNAGKLEQEIDDAYTLVNYGGRSFREAEITEEYYKARLEELKWAAIAQELRLQEREEQRRIREQIREEQKAKREFERAMREAAKEEDLLRKAMADAEDKIAAATEEQRAEFERQLVELNGKLKEAEERNQRAVSMAQMTRRGHVYIISNTGSFGDHIYKIGLTRRLEPLDRVKELGDASVPFAFDVHAMILSDDAPELENKLHKHFILSQVNKVNHRKEFFRANLAEIREQIEDLGIEAKWTMAAEAREYHETMAVEKMIEDDSTARDAWLNRQLTLDPTHLNMAVVSTEGSDEFNDSNGSKDNE